MTDIHDQWIDEALQALDGGISDSEFVLHNRPEGVGLCCGLCPPDGHSTACKGGSLLFTVGCMELWEFVHDARQHYEETHREVAHQAVSVPRPAPDAAEDR